MNQEGDLLAHYSFDASNATDDAGNGNNGTLLNSPTFVSARLGIGAVLNGSNTRIRTPSLPALANATISLWIKHNGSDDIYDRIFASNGHNFELAKDSSGLLKMYSATLGFGWVVTTYSLPQDQWTHLAVVRNGTSVTIYANGVSVATITANTASIPA